MQIEVCQPFALHLLQLGLVVLVDINGTESLVIRCFFQEGLAMIDDDLIKMVNAGIGSMHVFLLFMRIQWSLYLRFTLF